MDLHLAAESRLAVITTAGMDVTDLRQVIHDHVARTHPDAGDPDF